MRLLVLTQSVDKQDPTLGFFHNWILKLAESYKEIIVICLKKGEYSLPKNVKVFSLGKEGGESKVKYIINFFTLISRYHKEYDSVFVHMNEEFVLLGGFFWKILGKKIFFWRNHKKGSLMTKIAVSLSEKVFCTSKQSFTARFKKTVLMPVGIDTDLFLSSKPITERGNSFLSLGRIDPVKKIDLLAEVFKHFSGPNFKLTVVGNSTPKYHDYYVSILEKLSSRIKTGEVVFLDSIKNEETPRFYNNSRFFINLTPSGSFDKTIVEAMACGCLVLTPNQDLFDNLSANEKIDELDVKILNNKIEGVLKLSDIELSNLSAKNREYVLKNHSLEKLVSDLKKIIC